MANTREQLVVQDFPPELADERVGWITVHDAPASPDIKLVNVATATVGADGAALKYILGEDGELLHFGRDAGGFENATSIRIAIEPEGVAMQGIYRYFASERRDNAGFMRNNYGGYIHEEDKSWARSTSELPEVIKAKLEVHNLQQYYPDVYYNLNIIGVASGEVRRFDASVDEVLVPDPDMREHTARQLDLAEELLSTMQVIKAEDELMAHRLTVFSDVAASEVPDVFITSRERVAAYEDTMRGILPSIFAASGLYVPAGAGRGGREWPYMDPDAKTPEASYGRELEGLRAGSISRASHELQRELTEANYRLSYIGKGVDLLRRLHMLEQPQW